MDERKVLKVGNSSPSSSNPSFGNDDNDFQGSGNDGMMTGADVSSEMGGMDGGEGFNPSSPDGGPSSFDDMGGDGDNGGNEFDSDFDPGIDSDEQSDPRRYIQQLTGKLSQKLRQYNEEDNNPDYDLNKYVLGMIGAQASKCLDDDGRKDVIAKINNPDTSDDIASDPGMAPDNGNGGDMNGMGDPGMEGGNPDGMDNGEQPDMEPMGGNDNGNNNNQNNPQGMGESKYGFFKTGDDSLDEIVSNLLNPDMEMERQPKPGRMDNNGKFRSGYRKSPFSNPDI